MRTDIPGATDIFHLGGLTGHWIGAIQARAFGKNFSKRFE